LIPQVFLRRSSARDSVQQKTRSYSDPDRQHG
jgi:hypothetical protein